MASISSTEAPRGSNVWVGLDAFGAQTVSRLGRWFADDDAGRELAAANRLLPRLALPVSDAELGDLGEANDDAQSGGQSDVTPFAGAHSRVTGPDDAVTPYDPAGDRIQQALAEVLAERQSRAALTWADRRVLVPHVWLVADLLSPETAGLAPWVAALARRFRSLQVEVRIFLLLRNLSWGRPAAEQAEAERRIRALVTDLLERSSAGQGAAVAFIVSDRDGIGGLYTADETSAVAQRFTDLLLLGDVAHTSPAGFERVFTAPFTRGPGGWETMPAFGSVAGEALEWDAPALFRENAERRQQRLFTALAEPAPPTFDPDYPELKRVALAAGGWPALDLPRWSPRFWRSARDEFARANELRDGWLARARRWRHDILVTHEDRRANVEHQAQLVYRAYVGGLDDVTRTTLEDTSIPGYFSPMQRVYERAAADLRVRRAELGFVASPSDAPRLDAPGAIEDPEQALAAAENRLTGTLERKINPLLLAQVAILTFALAWIWTFLILSHLPQTFLGRLLRFLGAATTLPIDLQPRFAAMAEWQPASNAQLWFWSGIALGVPIASIAIFTALRQRVLLERSWKTTHDRARRWKQAAEGALQDDLKQVELALARQNLEAAEGEIEARHEQLRRLRKIGHEASFPPALPDAAISGQILPAKPPPQPMTDLQVAQIIAAFRRNQADDPGLRAAPRDMVHGLFHEAARIAGDTEPDLRLELPTLQRRIIASLPPDGAVRVQQIDSTHPVEFGPPGIARYLAVPQRVAADLRAPGGVAVIPVPAEDRFYAVVVQSGMSARRAFSLPAPDIPPPTRDGYEPNGSPAPGDDSGPAPAASPEENGAGANEAPDEADGDGPANEVVGVAGSADRGSAAG
jgi:hypothetical protein